MPRKTRTLCLSCGTEPERPGYKYCSNSCQKEFEYKRILKQWKAGKITGLQSTGIVTPWLKRYLREKFGDKCVMCGWSKVHPATGKVPLVADHIDGNWKNNQEENLRLLCPNCDALTPTFSNLNRGRGRTNRALSKRTREARGMRR
jgi:hypothetical protein